MRRTLIINADDYGLTEGVNKGILHAAKNGIVSSTSVMINHIAHQRQVVPENMGHKIGLGIHLNITSGKPILPPEDVNTLVDTDGNFIQRSNLFEDMQKINLFQVEKEFRAQITAYLIKFGRPDHLDSHHHIHLHPHIMGVFCQLAAETRTPIRMPISPDEIEELSPFVGQNALGDYITPDMLAEDQRVLEFSGVRFPDCFTENFFYGYLDEPEMIKSILRKLPEGITEVMCHPGFVDDDLLAASSYTTRREDEYKALIQPEIREMIATEQITLGRFTRV